MPTSEYFATSYREARQKFLTATDAACATVTSRVLQGLRGPENEELAMDVARLGPSDPLEVLVLISGTHGVGVLPDQGAKSAISPIAYSSGYRDMRRWCLSMH